MILVLWACAEEIDPCAAGEAVPAPTVLHAEDTCGTWSLEVGGRVAIEVAVGEDDVVCTGVAFGSVDLPYPPIYSSFDNDTPKWTFDVHAEVAGEGSLEVGCDDGTAWTGFFSVAG